MESDDDYEEELPKPRLNMKHGFIDHIRRNQIDRDNYDKKVKSQPRNRGRGKAHQKPESKLYVPPKRNDGGQKSNQEKEGDVSSQKSTAKPLFKLEYTTNDGHVHSILVKDDHDPSKLAKRFAHQAGIPKDLLDTLEWKIEQEQIKRS